VGQIVLQAAAQSMCKMCYGIEKRSIPHEYAKVSAVQYRKTLHHGGKPIGPMAENFMITVILFTNP
jgi:hypothetical protein